MTVLNQIEIFKSNDWLIAIVIAMLVSGILAAIISINMESFAGLVTGSILAFLAVFGILVCAIVESVIGIPAFNIPSGKYQYEVIVQPEAWAEVLEDYKIVDQRGEIYILEEKDDME